MFVEKTIDGIEFPLQTSILFTLFIWADGLTVIVNVCDVPVQTKLPFVNEGVTNRVAVIGNKPVLTAVKTGMFPVPDDAKPMLGVSFVQL